MPVTCYTCINKIRRNHQKPRTAERAVFICMSCQEATCENHRANNSPQECQCCKPPPIRTQSVKKHVSFKGNEKAVDWYQERIKRDGKHKEETPYGCVEVNITTVYQRTHKPKKALC